MAWVTADEQLAGGVGVAEQGGVTPTPTTYTFLEAHEIIKKLVDKRGSSNKCITLEDIQTDTGMTATQVKEHLDVMILDEAITNVYTENGNPMVCSIDAMQKLINKLRELKV